jgi:D-amino-acid dehydrogenase
MHTLAKYSQQRLRQLTDALDLDYERAHGVLVLLRGKRERSQAEATMQVLRELEVPFDLLDAAQCLKLEPGLNSAAPLHSAIGLPRDEVGNCRQFAQLLKAHAQQRGARFLFDHEVLAVQPGTRPRLRVREINGTPAGAPRRAQHAGVDCEFDALVVCAGHQSNVLLKPIGRRLPLMAVHGYSITAPRVHREGHAESGPLGAVMDEKYKVAISRLGQRIRVAGSAEIGGSVQQFNAGALDTLYKVLDDWFPGAARLSQAQRWKGARPMLPDGPPVLGPSGVSGVWLNLGHGSSGWALSCGSARALADLLASRSPAIDLSGLGVQRWLS